MKKIDGSTHVQGEFTYVAQNSGICEVVEGEVMLGHITGNATEDLKVREFTHIDAGQMNFYLNYMNENEKEKGDNPPVGIILCTHEDKAEVKFATTGLANKLFVARYKLQLPTERELKNLIRQDVRAFERTRPENVYRVHRG